MSDDSRFRFFDRVRTAIIIIVVVFHVSAAHTGFPVYIMEQNSHIAFAYFNLICNAFMMNTLFLVAGYFSVASIERRSRTEFVIGKLWRIGIPLLFGIIFLGPLMPYMGFASLSFEGLDGPGLLSFLGVYFGSLLTDWAIPVKFTTNTNFHQHHFWFLSVLLFIFCIQAWGYPLWKKWVGSTNDPPLGLRPSVPVFLGVACLTALFAVVGNVVSQDLFSTRVIVGVLQIGASFPTQVVYFALGVVAYRSRWFVDPDRIPKSILVWLLLAAGSITCACITGWWVFGVDDVPLHHHVAFQGSMALTCVSLVVLTHMLVYRFWRSPGRFSDSLSENSFGIYLVQYPVILALQLPLISWNPFHGFKWVVVSIASLLVSWLLAEFFIRKMPRVGMALTVALFGVILIAT